MGAQAMSEAVDLSAAMCFGVSAAYKESSNCRLEAQYGHQTGCDMIPMMMQGGFKARGQCHQPYASLSPGG